MSLMSSPISSRTALSVPTRVRLLTALALLSGCCGLAYEVLYLRALTTLLGDMLYVHAALLSTFLVGIALGAKLAGHWVRWLWLLEILTGVFAVALPALCRWLAEQPFLAAVSSSPSVTILMTIALLSVPSLLVGFSIPLFSAYIKRIAAGELAFQGIYMAYNLGALSSVLAVELLMVRHLGVALSLGVIGAINVFNGVVLLWMRAAPDRLPNVERRRFAGRVIAALALVSLASAAFQMFFLKLTYLVFSPHRENFAVGLSVTLLGIFLGAWVASRVRWRFETFLLLVPLTLGLTYVAYLPLVRLYDLTQAAFQGSELLVLIHKFAMGALFALPPMILFGATLPALMRSEQEVAGESGHLLWVSSTANAAGYLLYVLVGHPLLETHVLLTAIAGLALFGSLLAAGFRYSTRQWIVAAAGCGALLLLLATWNERNFYLAQWVNVLDGREVVTFYKSGAESATLIAEEDGEDEWVTYNGHPSIFAMRDGIVTVSETISGVIPALAAPSLERALVLGLGTGITGGASARVFDHTDIVEINDAFYEMMPRLAHANLDVGENPAASLHLADGRAFLVGKNGVYDAILNSIPAPTYYSASKIYTVEFYRRVAQALKPGGVFCSWLASENMSEAGLETVLSAMHQTFEYCDLRIIGRGYYMATCSAEPIRPRRFRDLPVQLNLVDQLQLGLDQFDLNEYFEDIRISDNIFEHYTPRVERENTDDQPVLEFLVVRGYQLEEMGDDPFLVRRQELNVDPVRLSEVADPERFLRRALTFYDMGADQFRASFLPLIKQDPELWKMWRSTGLGDDPNR